MDKMLLVERLKELYSIMQIQLKDGNWDYSPYMLGLANGMILSYNIVAGEDIQFKKVPDMFLEDTGLSSNSLVIVLPLDN